MFSFTLHLFSQRTAVARVSLVLGLWDLFWGACGELLDLLAFLVGMQIDAAINGGNSGGPAFND